jgi:hypothetical protein
MQQPPVESAATAAASTTMTHDEANQDAATMQLAREPAKKRRRTNNKDNNNGSRDKTEEGDGGGDNGGDNEVDGDDQQDKEKDRPARRVVVVRRRSVRTSSASATEESGETNRETKVKNPRAPRNAALKALELDKQRLERANIELEKELAIQKVRLEEALARVTERDRDVAKLEKTLLDERSESKRFYQAVDSRTNHLVDGMTHHLAKSHQSAMQTLQSSQQLNAQVISSTFGQSLNRLREKGARVRMLMPPMPADAMIKPEAKEQFHRQVAEYLTKRVPNLADGRVLEADIDKAIVDCQSTIEEERRRLKTTLSTLELKELHATLVEQETHLEGLKFERSMLAVGLANFERRQILASSATPNAHTVTDATTARIVVVESPTSTLRAAPAASAIPAFAAPNTAAASHSVPTPTQKVTASKA